MKRSNVIALLLLTILISCREKTAETTETTSTEAKTVVDTTESGRHLTELNKKIESDPKNADLYYERAKVYRDKRLLGEASNDIARALQLDSTKADYYVVLSDVMLASAQPSKTKQALEKCLELDPKNLEGNMKMAELAFIARDYKVVFKHINLLLREDVTNPKAYMIKGMAYKEMGDTSKAISSYQTAIEQDPKYYAPFVQLGILYAGRKNDLALQYYDGALKINPRSEEAIYGKGMFYQEVKHDYDKAIQEYTNLLQLNPKNAFAHFNLGFVHYEYLKVPDQAIKHYSDAIKYAPNYAEAYYNRGLTFESVGNIAAAKADYEKAMSIRPGYQLAMDGLQRVAK